MTGRSSDSDRSRSWAQGPLSLIVTLSRVVMAALETAAPNWFGPKVEKITRTPEEVIDLLERFARNPGDPKLEWAQWNDFVATPIKDQTLEMIRLECGDLMYAEDEIFSRKVYEIADAIRAGLTT